MVSNWKEEVRLSASPTAADRFDQRCAEFAATEVCFPKPEDVPITV